MSRARRDCPYHPGVPADTPCERCGQRYCPECVKNWNGKALGPLCRKARVRRRVIIGAIVAVMLAAPAVVIVWGFDQHQRYGAHRHTIRNRQKLLKRYPRSAPIRLRLVRDLLRAGRTKQARQELDRLLKMHPKHVGALMVRAELARKTHDREGALRYATRALIAAPRSRSARLAVSRAHRDLGRADKAEATLAAGLKADPRATDLALELAALLVDGKRIKEAREVLATGKRHAPSHSDRRRIDRALQKLDGQAR